MKTIITYVYLAIAGLFASVSICSGQISITKSNMPASGQNIIYSTSNDSIDVSKTGADTTWDYSHITPVSQDTYKYISPASANIIYSLLYSGDAALNVKVAGQKGAYEFFKTSSTEYTQEGVGISIPAIQLPISITYNPVDVIYHFPVKYGNVDSASFLGSTTLSTFTIKLQGKRKNTVDGWGKVVTPYNTYTCIRLKSVVHEIDSVLGTAVDNSRIEYKWLSTSEQIPVLEAVVTSGIQGAGGGMTLYYRDSYKHIVNPKGPVVSFNVADTNVYTSDTVSFNNTTTGGVQYNWVITPGTYSYAGTSTNTAKSPKVIFHAPGLYTVSLNATGTGGTNYLTKTDYINVTHNAGIGLNTENIQVLNLFPNPTSGEIQINAAGISGFKPMNITVFNATGKCVYSGILKSENGYATFCLKDFESGLYLLRINTDTQIFEGRVLKN